MPEPQVDVLIPSFGRPAALAVTLAGLASQTFQSFRIVISDQTEGQPDYCANEPAAVLRVLRASGYLVETHKHLPRRGMAEQRQFLLDQASAPYVLFLDNDLLLEPYVLGVMLQVIRQERCGFVGCAPIGLSYAEEKRPHQQAIEFWDRPVVPERIVPGGPEWARHLLHNAANVWHVQHDLGITPQQPRPYKISWVGGCVLFDTASLREAGGFRFWRDLPEAHCGEDVLAQLRVMARHGGCGILPSGVHHLELPTTIPDRRNNAPDLIGL
jgi:GT2 family glycosyltransferase